MVTHFELASQKGWCCHTFLVSCCRYLSFIFGIILKLYEYAICLQSFIDVAYTEVEIQLFEVGRPGVVQEAAPQEAAPPVQSEWEFVNFSAIFAEMLIFLSNLAVWL